MNKEKFYDSIRPHVNLTTQNVMGMDKVLDYLELHEDNLQHAAYIIATAWWETAQTMMPVREAYWLSESWRKKNLRYYPYYGRGYVQLTWEFNYKRASDVFGVDFVKKPDLVMEPEYALPILVVGSNEGWFTNKGLDDYIDEIDEGDSEELREYKNARRVINGVDKASTIADLALKFEKALKAAGYKFKHASEVTEKPVESIPEEKGTTTPETTVKPSVSLSELIIKIIKAIFGKG